MNTSTKQPGGLYAIVISHYLTSALCFLILGLMLLFSVKEFSGHYFHPKLLAITHMAALGWGTLIIFGACYQLIPVIFETDLVSYRLPWISFFLFSSGLALLIVSFWTFDPGILMQAGALLLLSAISIFAVVVFLTAKRNQKKASIYQEFIVTSCIWLLATAILGVLLVFNFRYPFLPKDHLLFLKLHAHMGIGGWFLMLIIGASSRLVPMFLVSRVQKEKFLNWSYYLINLALILFLADTYLYGLNAKTCVIALILVAGISFYLAYIVVCFRSRIKLQIDLPIINTLISIVFLIASIVTIPFIIHNTLDGKAAAIHYTTLYGTLIFMGWISSLILGQAFKTLPFIVWVRKYEHLAGKTKTPTPAELYKTSLLKIQTFSFILFSLGFYLGYIFKQEILITAGAFFLVVTAALYLVHLIVVLLHKSKINYDKL